MPHDVPIKAVNKNSIETFYLVILAQQLSIIISNSLNTARDSHCTVKKHELNIANLYLDNIAKLST